MIELHVITPEEKKQTFDISELFGMQKELDKRIGYKGTDKLDMLFRALIVEISEAWNETRAFKMWSAGFGIPKQGLLEELIDGLHFLMNIAIELDKGTVRRKLVESLSIQSVLRKDVTNVNMLFEWYLQDVLRAKRAWCQYRDLTTTVGHLRRAFSVFFRLCYLYGYRYEDIVRSYKEKNAENFERQDSGY